MRGETLLGNSRGANDASSLGNLRGFYLVRRESSRRTILGLGCAWILFVRRPSRRCRFLFVSQKGYCSHIR
jgi:hypothetical protein